MALIHGSRMVCNTLIYDLNQIKVHHANKEALLAETLMQLAVSSPATIVREEVGPHSTNPYT